MKTFYLFLCLLLVSCSTPTIRVVHYNIKELSTDKIDDQNNLQLKNAARVLRDYPFDVISLNEIQFDREGVPTPLQTTRGENIKKLAKTFGVSEYNSAFYPANTGENAKKKKDGSYYTNANTKNARDHADQLNFGVFPHQYSTGALFKYKIISEVVVKDIKWKDFNANVDLNKFRQSNGKKFPKEMKLFDKNFTDIVLDVDGHEVHFIFLHTVPAYHFGNKKSPNYKRNADQLRFLEWYLTGATDINVNVRSLKPLSPKDTFIAMGDFNTDINNPKNEGTTVLARLFKKTNTFIKQSEMNFTNEGGSYSPRPFRLMLDYIVSSKNLEPVAGGIIHPDWKKREELGCDGMPKLIPPPELALVGYLDKKKKQECWVLVDRKYQLLKDASDHYPIWGHFKLK